MSGQMFVRLIAAVLCITLVSFGFTYDSGWAFFGSVIAFLVALD